MLHKKNTYKWFQSILILFVVLTGCSNPHAFLEKIPHDSDFVAIIDPGIFVRSTQEHDQTQTDLDQILIHLNSTSPSLTRYIKYMLGNPMDKGLNTKDKIAIFKTTPGDSVSYYGISAHISNMPAFENHCINSLEEQDISYAKLIEPDYSYVMVNMEMVVAWNNHHLLALIPANVESRKNTRIFIKNYMDLPKSNSITNLKSFQAILHQDSDLVLYRTPPSSQQTKTSEEKADREGSQIISSTNGKDKEKALDILYQISKELAMSN